MTSDEGVELMQVKWRSAPLYKMQTVMHPVYGGNADVLAH